MIRISVVLFLLAFSTPTLAGPVVRLNTLDWCPYTCQQLPDGGYTTALVREAFESMGYSVEISFLPWPRAVRVARDRPGVVGYFPAYATDTGDFTLSAEIGEGPLGLAMRSGVAIRDLSVEELAHRVIGIVNGYGNSKPLAAAIAAGVARVEMAGSDEINLRKLAAGRIDAAEIDLNVFTWLMRSSPDLFPLRGQVSYGMTLETKTLHVAFNHTDNGRRMAAVFAEGLKKLNDHAQELRHLAYIAER